MHYTLLDHHVTHTESLWVRINKNSFEKTVISIIYRKPNTDVDQFQSSLLGVLEEVNVGKKSGDL